MNLIENTANRATIPAVPHKSTGSLLGGLLLGAVVAGMGAFFCHALINHGYKRAMVTRAWTETPCEITKSEVMEERPTPNSPMEYEAIIHYAYTFEGERFENDSIKLTDGPTRHKDKAEKTIAEWPVGSSSVCWVNPEAPENAVLKHNTKAVGYTVWFPGLFVIGGLGIMIASIRANLRKEPA